MTTCGLLNPSLGIENQRCGVVRICQVDEHCGSAGCDEVIGAVLAEQDGAGVRHNDAGAFRGALLSDANEVSSVGVVLATAGRDRSYAGRDPPRRVITDRRACLMRLLVLGGTRFLSKQIAHDAVRRGHQVICAARGVSGSAPDGAELLVIDRDKLGAINRLSRERFDAVVDVATGAVAGSLRPSTSSRSRLSTGHSCPASTPTSTPRRTAPDSGG